MTPATRPTGTAPGTSPGTTPHGTPKEYRIASVPADGIGPEVISAGLEVLEAVAARDAGFTLKVDH